LNELGFNEDIFSNTDVKKIAKTGKTKENKETKETKEIILFLVKNERKLKKTK
jgi:hypothetical protein